jgi:hypothetical protein
MALCLSSLSKVTDPQGFIFGLQQEVRGQSVGMLIAW